MHAAVPASDHHRTLAPHRRHVAVTVGSDDDGRATMALNDSCRRSKARHCNCSDQQKKENSHLIFSAQRWMSL